MALIECPECKRAVSDRADACPGCGYPMATDAAKSANKSPAPQQSPKPTKDPPKAKKQQPAGGKKAPGADNSPLGKILQRKPPGRPDRSFGATHPDYAKSWHTTENKGVKPSDVFVEFDNKLLVSWKPPCGHVFRRQIKNWIQNPVCPECGKMPEGFEYRSMSGPLGEVRPAKPHPQGQVRDPGYTAPFPDAFAFFCLAWILGVFGTAFFFVSFPELETSVEESSFFLVQHIFTLFWICVLWAPLSIWPLLLLCFNRRPQRERRAKKEADEKRVEREEEAKKRRAEAEKKRRVEAEKKRNPELVPARIPRDADDFETVCAEWMKKAGFPDATRTPKGPDGGIDTIASNAVGQAKFHPSQKVTGESIRALAGSKIERNKSRALFFHYGPGYTPDAIQAARNTGVELYQLNVETLRFKRIA